METDEEHRRPLTGGSRTPQDDKNDGVSAGQRSPPTTPEPLAGMAGVGVGVAGPGRPPSATLSPAPGPEVLLMRPDSAKTSPPALPPRPRVPPRPTALAAAAARGSNGGGGCCGLCWRGGGLRKYVFLCAACGGLSSLLGILFLAVYFLLRSYTSSLVYFETVPTYVPASMLLSTGLVVMCLARRRNRYTFLMKLCGCACLASAALCVIVTVATTVVHMSRLQSLSQCHYQQRTQTCTCYSALIDATATDATDEGARYVFNAIPDCDVIHGALYSCLRAMFGLSVVGILVCIFSGMLVYQLFSHEKKKMYWEQLELRCRYLYRRQQSQPAGQRLAHGLAHGALAHHCGSCSCCDDCRDLHTPPPSIPWEFMDSRYWAPGRVGNLYSPNPEDHHPAMAAARAAGPVARGVRPGQGSGSAWSWRRLPWGRSSGGASSGGTPRPASDGGALCGVRPVHGAANPDSQYGFSALGQLGPLGHLGQLGQLGLGPHAAHAAHPGMGRDPCTPFLLSQVYPAPQPHPRPFAPASDSMGMPLGVPMPLADDLGPQFYLWGPPPPYMSNPASAANSPARHQALPTSSTGVPQASAANPYPLLGRNASSARPHRCAPTGTAGTAVSPASASAADRPLRPLSPGDDADPLGSLSSPEKTVPRKKRKKATSGDGGAEGVEALQADVSESPVPGAPFTAQAQTHAAHAPRKTKKRADASLAPRHGQSGHGARYAHRAPGSHRPASADSCCAERSCCQSHGHGADSDGVDTEGYSYPRLKFPPPQPAGASPPSPLGHAPSDSQSILAAFDNQAFHDGAPDCPPPGAAGTSSGCGGGAAVKTLTLGPQGPLVCKKRPSDPSESEVYFGDDSSCCNASEQHSSLTYEEPSQQQQGRELRAFKLVHAAHAAHAHVHVQQRSMDGALPSRPVSVHRPSASTLSDTAVVDPSSHYHPGDAEGTSAAALRQRMPLPLPHQRLHGPSLAPDAQYESIADSNVYTYISPLSLGPASFKAPCGALHAAPKRTAVEPAADDADNAVNALREAAPTEAGPASDERPGVDV